MKILVTGGRLRADWWVIFEALNEQRANGPFCLVHGACPVGADWWAHMWVAAHPECPEVTYPAKWRREDGTYNRAAGHERNALMITCEPDLVLAFPHPEGSGTQGMMRLARDAGIKVIEY